MEPKEKAKELVDRFWSLSPQGYDRSPYYKYAKQCAFIAVDEIIKNVKEWDFTNDNSEHHFLFWEKVKKEIKNV